MLGALVDSTDGNGLELFNSLFRLSIEFSTATRWYGRPHGILDLLGIDELPFVLEPKVKVRTG